MPVSCREPAPFRERRLCTRDQPKSEQPIVNISLIITTYNWKEALELSLSSVSVQSEMPDEVIVADDGSREDTADLIRRMAASFPIPLLHVWQEDCGFRAARIRNKAIAGASGAYILLVDGDVILHKDFVAHHRSMAQRGVFCQGSRVLLSPAKTVLVLANRQLAFSPFESGLGNRKNAVASHFLSMLFSHKRNYMRGIRTCNFAFWKADGIAVNGFNEDFQGYGREDSEFAARLMNSGIMRKNVRFAAAVYHLHHPLQPRKFMEVRDAMLHNAVENRLVRCRNGIDRHLRTDDGLPLDTCGD